MEIIQATELHVPAIQELANKAWYATYSHMVPIEQIAYMLKLFYSDEVLHDQLEDPRHHFLVMMEGDILQGYSHCIEMMGKIKLSKLYFLPDKQRSGLGRMMMQAIEELAQELNYHLIELYVNRGNPAQFFYEKLGYQIVESVDIPLGEFWLNDYIMHKQLNQ